MIRLLLLATLCLAPLLPAQAKQDGRCTSHYYLTAQDRVSVGKRLWWVGGHGTCYGLDMDRALIIIGTQQIRFRLTWDRYYYCDVLVQPELLLRLNAEPKRYPCDLGQDIWGPVIPNDPRLVGLTFYSQLVGFRRWDLQGFTNSCKTTVTR